MKKVSFKNAMNNPIDIHIELKTGNKVDVVWYNRTCQGSIFFDTINNWLSSNDMKLDNLYIFVTDDLRIAPTTNGFGMSTSSDQKFAHMPMQALDPQIEEFVGQANNVEYFVLTSSFSLGSRLMATYGKKYHVPAEITFRKDGGVLTLRQKLKENYPEYGWMEIDKYVNHDQGVYTVEDTVSPYRERFQRYENLAELLKSHPINKILTGKQYAESLQRNPTSRKDWLKKINRDPTGFIRDMSSAHSQNREMRGLNIPHYINLNGGDTIWIDASFDSRSMIEFISGFDFSTKDRKVLIDSPGGSPSLGFRQMIDLINGYSGKVVAQVHRQASSLGAIALFCFDGIEVTADAKIMIHCGHRREGHLTNEIEVNIRRSADNKLKLINKVLSDFFIDPATQASYDSQNDIFMSGIHFVAHFNDSSNVTYIDLMGKRHKPSECRRMLRWTEEKKSEDLADLAVYRERYQKLFKIPDHTLTD